MNLPEALMTSLAAIKAADSGSGGLSDSAGDAFVLRLVYDDDANYALDRDSHEGTTFVSIVEKTVGTWGTGASTTTEKDIVLVRLLVVTRRDAGRAKQDATVYRWRTKLDGVTPASQTGWAFNVLSLEHVTQLDPTGVYLRTMLEFSVRVAAGTIVELSARQASATFSGAEGAAIGAALVGNTLDESFNPEVVDVTRWGDRARRRSVALNDATISLRFTHSSLILVPPTGTSATLVVYSLLGTHSIVYTDAIVVGWRHAAATQGQASPQDIIITFALSVAPASPAGTNPISSV